MTTHHTRRVVMTVMSCRTGDTNGTGAVWLIPLKCVWPPGTLSPVGSRSSFLEHHSPSLGLSLFFPTQAQTRPVLVLPPPPLLFDSLHQLRQHPLISYRPTEPFRRDQLFIGVDRPLQFFTAAGAAFIKSTNAHGRLLTINNGYK